MKYSYIVILVVIVLSFVLGIVFYDDMPEKVASHWNSKGEVDGYMGKFWGVFLMPIVSVGIFLLMFLIPRIDPLKKNVEKFKGYYHNFILVIVLFMFYIYILSMAWNLGYGFNMGIMIIPALAVLFFYAGVLISKAKMNWFIGIRTPWTLSDPKVWDSTHRLGGKLFKWCSLVILLGVFFGKYSIWFILVPIFGVVVWLVVFSYLEFRRLKK